MAGKTGVEVARISVKVSPDTSKFRRELKRDLDDIERSVKAKIDVEADMRGFRQRVNAATHGLKAKVELDVDRSQFSQLKRMLSKSPDGSGFKLGGGGDISMLLIGVAALAAAAPLVGVVATGLAAIPGLVAGIGVPMGAVALGLDGIKEAASQLQGPFDHLKEVMSGFTKSQFAPVFEQLGSIFPMLERSLPRVSQGVADLFQGFTSTITSSGGMAQIESMIGNISAALTAAAPGVSLFTNGFLTLANSFSQKLPAISGWFDEMGAKFTNWVNQITSDGSLSAAFDGLGATLNSIVTSLAPLFQQGIEFMADKDKVGALTATFEVLGAVLQGVVAASGAFFESLSQIAYFIQDVTAKAQAVGEALRIAWDGLPGIASSVWNSVVSTVSASLASAVNAVASGGQQILSEVSSWPGKLAGALAGLAQAGIDAGKNLVQGLINGISGMIGSAVSKAKELASGVAGAVKGFLGIHSPSRLMQEYGQYTAQGFGIGLENGFEPVLQQAKDMAQKISDAFASGADPTGVLGGLSGADVDRIEKTLAFESKRLEAQAKALDYQAKLTGDGALKARAAEIRQQKEQLSLQEDMLDLTKDYSDELGSAGTGDNPLVKASSGLLNAPVDFAKATGKQFMSDLGISGDGLIPRAITEGIQYIFQIGSVDEAMSIKDRQESKQALSVVGRT
ncbi:hypothetical protein BH09ACT8_BH09ACT8_27210 [soil metagenome]